MKVLTTLHRRLGPQLCSMTGEHHLEFVLVPGWRRYAQRCRRCGRMWRVEPPTRIP